MNLSVLSSVQQERDDISHQIFISTTHGHVNGGGSDLDLLGNSLFRAYLWYVSHRGILPIRHVKASLIREGAGEKDRAYWRESDVRRYTFDLKSIREFCHAEKLTVESFFNELSKYLRGDGSFGVVQEYREFIKMWRAVRLSNRYNPCHIFLEVVFGYSRERLGDSHDA
jgi:hypothetical protein